MKKLFRVTTAIFAVLTFASACNKTDYQTSDTAHTVVSYPPGYQKGSDDADAASEPAAPITLTDADIDGFVKGIAREAELVKEASQKSASAKTPQERGEAIQAGFETNTIVAAAPVTGLSAERYKLVRETIARIMTTLDFQGVIDGPQSLDTANANAEMKARLASDPYSALDAGSAALLKSRLKEVTPAWLSYIDLTAVNG